MVQCLKKDLPVPNTLQETQVVLSYHIATSSYFLENDNKKKKQFTREGVFQPFEKKRKMKAKKKNYSFMRKQVTG